MTRDLYDGLGLTGIIPKTVRVDPDLRRRLVAGIDLLRDFGPAWRHRFVNLYVTTPEGAVLMYWPERPWVAYVGVESSLRDRGLGSGLVAWALARSFEAGARSALILLSPGNRTALRAYEKVGFRRHRLVDVLEREL